MEAMVANESKDVKAPSKFKCSPGDHVGPWDYTMYGASCKHCGYYTDD